MNPESLTAALKQEAFRLGFDLVGATAAVCPSGNGHFREWLELGYAGEMRYLADRADAYAHPSHVLDGVQSILMLAVNYRTVEPAQAAPGQGTVSRYGWGDDYHDVIRRQLHALADFHRELVPKAQVRGVIDTAPLLEREFAQQAGLGWIGKNTMLVNRRFGSWPFLAGLLTTEPLAYDEPIEKGHCGSCRMCLDACPTGALVEPYRLDARKCISYLTIELRESIPTDLRSPIGDQLFGCDLCQEACPWNGRTPMTDAESYRPKADSNPMELAQLFLLDEAAFRERFRGTPLWRGKRAGLLRNAAIVLGNRPHPPALPSLLRGLEDDEPIVRAACAWALKHYADQTAQRGLCDRMAVETNPTVRAELEA